MMHSVDKHKVMKELVTERLFELQSILEGACLHIQGLYQAPLGILKELMHRAHPWVASHDTFVSELENKFKELLKAQLDKANSGFQEMIYETTRFVSVDLMTRFTAIAAQAPVRRDMLAQDTAKVFLEEDEDKPDPEAAGAAASGLAGEMQHLLRNPVVKERKPNPKEPQRLAERRNIMHRIKLSLHKDGRHLAPIDVVEGGLQELAPEDYQNVNVEEFNKDAKQYTWILKGLILLRVELLMQRHVFEPFYQNLLLTDMTKNMNEWIDGLSVETGGKTKIQEMIDSTDSQDHDRQIKQLLVRIDLLGQASASLDAAMKPHPNGSAPRPCRPPESVKIFLPGMRESFPRDQTKFFLSRCTDDLAAVLKVPSAHVRVELEANRPGHAMELRLSFVTGARTTIAQAREQLAEGGRMLTAAQHYCRHLYGADLQTACAFQTSEPRLASDSTQPAAEEPPPSEGPVAEAAAPGPASDAGQPPAAAQAPQ